ncbi:MAG: T9SS type A sorting domain-containing protein [Flavobacteriales bacterium]
MLHRTLLVVGLCATFSHAQAQCNEVDETKVLLVGDSWAFFMGIDQTINEVFEKWGHSNFKFRTNLVVAENGAETDDFLQQDKQDEIQQLIDDDPNIKVVHLSIGGNDVLGDWHVSFTQAQTDSLKAAVQVRLIEVIEFIKTTRPDIHILWSGYTYPNFEEVIESIAPLQTIHPFYGTWEGMGFPTFIQLNTILNEFSDSMAAYAATDPRVDFVPATGLMQYTYGQDTPLGVPPGGTYPAYTVPLPTGDPQYPSPRNSMRDYGLTRDCFHLSAGGYRDLIEYHTRKFYHKYLMSDLYVLSDGGANDGSVSSEGSVSTSLMMGRTGSEDFATVLSFNTTGIPSGQQVAKASIFLRRQNLVGTNPISGGLQLKVIDGHFGTSPSVEVADWTAFADATGTPCRFGSNGGDGHWIRLEVPSAMLPFITANEGTQFILSDPSGTDGRVTFNNASDPDFAPVLNLTFEPLSVGIEHLIGTMEAGVYPNPTTGTVFFGTVPQQVVVMDVLGQVVLRSGMRPRSVDLTSLPAGTYLLQLVGTDAPVVQRVVKW